MEQADSLVNKRVTLNPECTRSGKLVSQATEESVNDLKQKTNKKVGVSIKNLDNMSTNFVFRSDAAINLTNLQRVHEEP